jgi:hypothetical protein
MRRYRNQNKADYDYLRLIEKIGEQPGYYNPNLPALRRAIKAEAVRRVPSSGADHFELTEKGRNVLHNIRRIKDM